MKGLFKLKKQILVLLALVLFFSSCSNSNNEVKETISEKNEIISPVSEPINKTQDETLLLDKKNTKPLERFSDFHNYWTDNPITKDYTIGLNLKNSKSTNPRYSKFNLKYYELWDKELNNVYNLLLKELDERSRGLMINSQKGWLDFHINEDLLIFRIIERSKLSIQPLFSEQRKNRIKSRTLELIWLYEQLCKPYNYLYKSNFPKSLYNYNIEDELIKLHINYSVFKVKNTPYSNIASNNILDITLDNSLNQKLTTLGVGALIGNYSRAWDKELNFAYTLLIDSLSIEEKELLKVSELGWISHKEYERDFYEAVIFPISGTSRSLNLVELDMKFNKRRTLELMEYDFLLNNKKFTFLFDDNL